MEKGAASPGRWHVWQCFCKIGATSLVNVGGGLLGSCPSAYPAQHSVPASRMNKYFMNFPTSTICTSPYKNVTEQGNLTAGVGFTFSLIPLRTVVAHLCPNKAISARIRGSRRDGSCSIQTTGGLVSARPTDQNGSSAEREKFISRLSSQPVSGAIRFS